MRNFLFILASTASLAMIDPARSQYVPYPASPGYTMAPGYTAPSTTPGYNWREQRGNDDWRNNTFREQRFDENSRNNNWRTQRANEDWRQRENYEKQRTPNNATDRGYVGKPTDRTTNNPIDTNQNKTDTNNNPADKGYVGAR